VRKPTIYEALRDKLGREPTNPELRAEVERIKQSALVELAEKGRLPHQRSGKRPRRGHHAAKKTPMKKHLHFAGYDFTAGPEGTVVHRQTASTPAAFHSGDRVAYRDVNLWQEGTVTGSDGKWVMVRWDSRPFVSREWAPNLRHVSTGAPVGRGHATKKTPAQLDREINEVLSGGSFDRQEAVEHLLRPSARFSSLATGETFRFPGTQVVHIKLSGPWYRDGASGHRFKTGAGTAIVPVGGPAQAHATKRRSAWPSVVGSHGLGTADERTAEGAYWIVTVPTGYRVDYKPWGPSNEVDLGTFSSRQRARSKITEHARSVGASVRHATKKKSSGAHQKWNVYSGGKWVTAVFYVPEMDADEVRRSLIRHDGYPDDIKVRRAK
jgi:hypothetical protein